MINWHPELFLDWAYCMLIVGAITAFTAFVIITIVMLGRLLLEGIRSHGKE